MAASVLSRYLDPELLEQIAHRPLEPSQLVLGSLAGGHKSPLAGFAVEFAGHREYVMGDDPRHIDWRLFYKRDRLFIKQYEMETNYVCQLLLDVSASMRYGEEARQKLFYAAQLATTLAYSIVRHHDKVAMATFDNEVRSYVPPGNTPAQIIKVTESLDAVAPVEKTALSHCLLDLLSRMGRREIVMIFSDFFTDLAELEDVIQRMRYARHEVVLFQILHHDELEFSFGGMVRFEGLEGGDPISTQTEDVRRAYLDALAAFRTKLEEICRRNLVEYVVVDTSLPAGEALVRYLDQRELIMKNR